jgi:hypothetical protein
MEVIIFLVNNQKEEILEAKEKSGIYEAETQKWENKNKEFFIKLMRDM